MFTQRSYLDGFMRSMRMFESDDELQSVRDRRKMLLSAIRRVTEYELTQKQREVVDLCLFGGKSVTEAARILGRHKSTVSRHLQASQRHFEKSLKYFFSPHINQY